MLGRLQRPGSPLRAALLSLGASLSLLVACTLVVATLLRAVNETVPQNAPALVFYDVQTEQIPLLQDTLLKRAGSALPQAAPTVVLGAKANKLLTDEIPALFILLMAICPLAFRLAKAGANGVGIASMLAPDWLIA